VHVSPSAQAPHTVDHIYYGRGDRVLVVRNPKMIKRWPYLDAATRRDKISDLDRAGGRDPTGG
jgi:hypothetical protein